MNNTTTKTTFMENNTISNIQKLKTARDNYKLLVGDKYAENVTPFCEIVTKIMQAQNINEFEALKIIQDNLPIYKKPGADVLFGCAIYEIVEEKYLKELEK